MFSLFWNRECPGVIDDQVMAVVGRDDHDRLVPVAMGFNPVDDAADGSSPLKMAPMALSRLLAWRAKSTSPASTNRTKG